MLTALLRHEPCRQQLSSPLSQANSGLRPVERRPPPTTIDMASHRDRLGGLTTAKTRRFGNHKELHRPQSAAAPNDEQPARTFKILALADWRGPGKTTWTLTMLCHNAKPNAGG